MTNEKKPTWGSRLQPLLFVLAGFGCWFIFFTLARVLLECAPFGPCSLSELPPPEPLGWPDTIVLLTTMLFAIWAAKRLVFARED